MSWTVLLRKAYRLFFDDPLLSVPTLVWIVLIGVVPVGGLWRSISLFTGIAAILLYGTLTAPRKG